MAQKGPRSVLGLPTRLHVRSNDCLGLVQCLFRIPKVCNPPLLLIHMLVPIHSDSRSTDGPNSANIGILIISIVCAVLSVTEIILYVALRLHPLTYLILQLIKTITWLVLFALAAVDTMRVQGAKAEGKQGYSLGTRSGYVLLVQFVEDLVLL